MLIQRSECDKDINLSIVEINKTLIDENAYMSFCCYENIDLIFDVSPHEYLEFMEKDLDGTEKRDLINGLSNAKRALDCQIEMLLYALCLKDYSDKGHFGIPKKIDLLNKVGIVAPRILNKINKIRNVMEHEFYSPGKDEVQDFADVVLLFIAYTDKYLYGIKSDCEIECELKDRWYNIRFNRKKQKIVIEVKGEKQDCLELKICKKIEEHFIEFIKIYMSIISEF